MHFIPLTNTLDKPIWVNMARARAFRLTTYEDKSATRIEFTNDYNDDIVVQETPDEILRLIPLHT